MTWILPSSNTPTFSHRWISRSTRGSSIRCSTNFIIHSWSKLPKNFRSASNTQPTFSPLMIHSASPKRYDVLFQVYHQTSSSENPVRKWLSGFPMCTFAMHGLPQQELLAVASLSSRVLVSRLFLRQEDDILSDEWMWAFLLPKPRRFSSPHLGWLRPLLVPCV